MAVQLITQIKRYQGLSTDVKPTEGLPVGSTFHETDTNNKYVFNGATWTQTGFFNSDGSQNIKGSVTVDGSVSINGKQVIASGKKTDADGTNRTITTSGFDYVAIVNDGPGELRIGINESSITGTKTIFVKADESFEAQISGTTINYSMESDSCIFRYFVR